MSRNSQSTSGPDTSGESPARKGANRLRFGLLVGLVILVNLGLGWQAWRRGRIASPVSAGPVSFAKEVAPILFRNCAGCHRPGQSAPFTLLTYADAKRHAKEIAEVTARRYMPPWAPEPGHGEFADVRRLSDAELATIQRWVQEGAVEGDQRDLPPEPKWSGDWQLGPPDLVVQAPPYRLRADGRDIYHNFVIPIPVSARRFVKGVEFLPGNARVVHHAFIKVDATTQSRRLAAKQSPPGFDGMENPESAVMPGGQLLSWQPGKMPSFAAPGLPWVLQTNTDLVLQVHMNPSGKSETVQPSVGFYFTETPPTNSPFRLRLTTLKLDIPAGESNYVAEESYVLPVDTTFIRVGAHAHYLGKDLSGYALLPNGEKKWLLRIKDWDFKWQGDYQYAEPVRLPKGTKVVMSFTYDNSAANPRNPNSPPKRVLHGLQTKDEMGELYFQILPDRPQDYVVLARDFSNYFLGVSRDFFAFRVAQDDKDADAHKRLGRIWGAVGQSAEAVKHLARSVELDPNQAETHFDLGLVYMRMGRVAEAYAEFRTTVLLNPEDSAAFGSLGILASQAGRQDEARRYLERALEINPQDDLARRNLERISPKQP